jgi:hypothetical protein
MIFRVARFSGMYKQDLRARSEIATSNSGYSNDHIFSGTDFNTFRSTAIQGSAW